MFHYLKLYKIQLKYALTLNMVYHKDFIMWFIVDFIWGIISIIFFTALYGKIKLLGGWNYHQMLLLLGWVMFLKAGFWGLLWPNILHIPNMINKGELDLWITKPINSQFLLSTRYISTNVISSIMIGIALLTYTYQKLQFSFNILEILKVFIVLISGIIILYSLWFISVTIVFYFGRISNMAHLFPQIFDIAQFPKTAFPIIIQIIITFVIPVGIIAYTPAQIILHRAQRWEPFLPVFLAAFFLYLSHKFWNYAIKSYTSASS